MFRHSAKNFWIFLKKILCRVPRRGTRQRIFFFEKTLPSALPMALGKDPENCNFFYIPLQQTIYIYIHQSSHLYHQHALYITSTRIFNKSITNSPKFNITSLLLQVRHHKVQHLYCGDGNCRCGPLDSGEGPDCGEGLT